MTKQQKIAEFDPNQPGLADASIFGLPFTAEESEIIIIPVPWEVTVSYGAGASAGPQAILDASFQVDLFHQEYPDLWKLGIYIVDAPAYWQENSEVLKEKAQAIIQVLEDGGDLADHPALQQNLKDINLACEDLNREVKEQVIYWTKKGKKVALLGGDHSVPLGYYQALGESHTEFGILHFDAHMDLRKAYEGFTYSHASIMYNASQLPQVSRIVQVGLRDFCEQEVAVAKEAGDRIKVFTDLDLKAAGFKGKTWAEQCDEIISCLPAKVSVSFDIDSLYQWYCPNTGTPVPGGLSFEQATFLLSALANSDREIIGFDLVEVSPGDNDWDGNVGARLLFHLCGAFAKSQGLNVGDRVSF
ncbi:agmatinase family protein [Albibacterium sp.]|uniref:agmatinase family protein n=1 Tax=Albibacterium sp. TaxID=2952885 RepID=UPI002CE7F4D1|nr:agmatinase family protein [Albibacterium sp.]HUH19214.1 agmatinase family protein [Albibacterium sp.]